MKYPGYTEIKLQHADELWDSLSPTKELVKKPHKFIYRGQGDASWQLIPSILRKSDRNPVKVLWGAYKADEQVFAEISLLRIFVDYCDNIGIKLPNDSLAFREGALNPEKNQKYLKNPSLWPNPALLELMALAQHHRVPTRLLDWAKIPYVAAYFAASAAISTVVSWEHGKELAVWALNTERLNLYQKVKLLRVPGAITSHLSAQSGVFTVHPHNGYRDNPFQVIGLEEEFTTLPDTPLIKITIPIEESTRLLELCDRSGFSAATMYPTADGAGLAVIDAINALAREKNHTTT